MRDFKTDLRSEIARPAQTGLRSVWQWRPLASLTPAGVADILRRAAMGDGHDFLLAADDIREKDLHYRAVLQTRIMAVAALPIEVQPLDDSALAQQGAELVRQALGRLNLPELVAHLMDAVAKGYSVAEIVWDLQGPRWLPEQVLVREAHWFTWDRDTGRLLRLVDGSPEGMVLSPDKMIVHAPPLCGGVPLQGGLARSALWAWVFKSYALRDWARFCELFGQPIRLGKYHQGASSEDVAVLKRAAFELGSDAAAVIPQEMVLELIESGSKAASADLYHKLIEYLDKQISKAVLGQTMSTDDGASLSQAQVHEGVRRNLVQADAMALAATLERDLVRPLVRLNLGEAAPLPKLRLVLDEPRNMAALAERVARLAEVGAAIPQAWVRSQFGIPEFEAGEPLLGGVPAGAPVGAPALPEAAAAQRVRTLGATKPAAPGPGGAACLGCGSPAHSSAAPGPSGMADAAAPMAAPDLPEMQADRLERECAPGWVEIMTHIAGMVERAPSLPALRDALLQAYGDLPQQRLTEAMALGFAAADLAGRFAVQAESGEAAQGLPAEPGDGRRS